jgi:hypothetical protein
MSEIRPAVDWARTQARDRGFQVRSLIEVNRVLISECGRVFPKRIGNAFVLASPPILKRCPHEFLFELLISFCAHPRHAIIHASTE